MNNQFNLESKKVLKNLMLLEYSSKAEEPSFTRFFVYGGISEAYQVSSETAIISIIRQGSCSFALSLKNILLLVMSTETPFKTLIFKIFYFKF